jgi:hypothetical protein
VDKCRSAHADHARLVETLRAIEPGKMRTTVIKLPIAAVSCPVRSKRGKRRLSKRFGFPPGGFAGAPAAQH